MALENDKDYEELASELTKMADMLKRAHFGELGVESSNSWVTQIAL